MYFSDDAHIKLKKMFLNGKSEYMRKILSVTYLYNKRCRCQAGLVHAPPYFGISINPISNRGVDYARHITTTYPPDFQTFLQPT